MSEFKVEVVRIGPCTKHPNADTLSITNVNEGYPVIFKTGDFKEGDLAVYVPVDALVPVDRPEFKFLDSGKRTMERIKAKKLRGVFSMGLLIPAAQVVIAAQGGDLQAFLGIDKYVPEAEREPTVQLDNRRKTRRELGRKEKVIAHAAIAVSCLCTAFGVLFAAFGSPLCFPIALGMAFYTLSGWMRIKAEWRNNIPPHVPVYDIEGLRKHPHAFQEGEPVWITEKIHGCNARFVFSKGRLFIGSRTQFRTGDGNVWAEIAKAHRLDERLKMSPDVVLFGEVYGKVQDLTYGVPPGEVRFAAFDAMDLKTGRYYDANEFREFCLIMGIPVVPTLYEGAFSHDLAVSLAEGKSTLPGAEKQVREGMVCKPLIERHDHGLGRVFLKLPGQGYLLRKGQAE